MKSNGSIGKGAENGQNQSWRCGLGHRGRTMFKRSAKFADVECAAACDILPRNWYEKQWHMDAPLCEMFPDAAFFENYDEMLEKAKLDAVIVETGADIHADFCIKALEKNINVLTDIPVVANLMEADRLWKAAQKSSAMISIGANPNEQKFTVLLKEFYQSGKLGKPYCLEAEYIHWVHPERNKERAVSLTENGACFVRRLFVTFCVFSTFALTAENELCYIILN